MWQTKFPFYRFPGSSGDNNEYKFITLSRGNSPLHNHPPKSGDGFFKSSSSWSEGQSLFLEMEVWVSKMWTRCIRNGLKSEIEKTVNQREIPSVWMFTANRYKDFLKDKIPLCWMGTRFPKFAHLHGNIKGTLMQIWKSPCLFYFI